MQKQERAAVRRGIQRRLRGRKRSASPWHAVLPVDLMADKRCRYRSFKARTSVIWRRNLTQETAQSVAPCLTRSPAAFNHDTCEI